LKTLSNPAFRRLKRWNRHDLKQNLDLRGKK
jgi:hypothetical protein